MRPFVEVGHVVNETNRLMQEGGLRPRPNALMEEIFYEGISRIRDEGWSVARVADALRNVSRSMRMDDDMTNDIIYAWEMVSKTL